MGKGNATGGLFLVVFLFFVLFLLAVSSLRGCEETAVTPTPFSPSVTPSVTSLPPTDAPPTATTRPTLTPSPTRIPPTETAVPSPTPTNALPTVTPILPTSTPSVYRSIARGDTYWQVAADWYGNPYCWPSLQTANGWDRFMLPVGGKMALPDGCLEKAR